MADLREHFDDPEEGLRTLWAGLQKHMHTAMVSSVAENSDGKTLKAQPTIKQRVSDRSYDETSFSDFPLLLDVPIHHPGAGGVTHTFPIKAGDELLSIFTSRPHDTWFQSGGTQQPIADRMHSLSDAIAIPGVRSTPRELKQISTDAAQVRSDDKHHVVELHPQSGITHTSVDPSTASASDSFDPFSMATKFFRHIVQGATGIIGSAVNGATQHSHGVDHDVGAWMSAMASGGTNFVRAHPVLGSLISALDGKHSVTATLGGVMLKSVTSIGFDCPAGGLNLPSGGVSSSALATGAAASNVGTLGGDLSGTLPNPKVTGLGNVDAHTLPSAASDAAAAALTPPVPVGGLYRNTTISTGVSVLCVRMA